MNGFLIIDKEKNMTSRDIDNQVMGIFNTKKVGHLGTLDPLATGVLVIAVGSALKVISLIENARKKYLATIKLGIQTDTLDISGKILKTSEKRASKEELIEVLNSLVGDNYLKVPKYSAVKVAGKKLYEYARANEEVALPTKLMHVYSANLISYKEDEYLIEFDVSYGSYIRSIIDEIGNRLSIAMTMSELRRTQSGDFKIEDAVKLDDVNEKSLISILDVLNDFSKVEVSDELKNKILTGAILERQDEKYPLVFIDKNKEVLAIYKLYEKDEKFIKPLKVIYSKNFNE